jgi:hypothetical protein
MRNATAEAWVVYSYPTKASPDGMRGVCEQGEWDALDRAKPGFYTLIQAGIEHEGEAERLARGNSGAARPRNAKVAMATWPGEVATTLSGPAGPVAG